MTEWISVKDRLPEESLMVLVWVPSEIIHPNHQIAAFIEHSGCFVGPTELQWYDPEGYCFPEEVTHWMLLPEGPK